MLQVAGKLRSLTMLRCRQSQEIFQDVEYMHVYLKEHTNFHI